MREETPKKRLPRKLKKYYKIILPPCEIYGHHIVPLTGFDNLTYGEYCSVCNKLLKD